MKINICHICSNFDAFFVDFMKEQEKQGIKFRVFYFRGRERGLPTVEAPNLDIRLNHNQWMRFFFFLKEYFVYKDFLKLYKDEEFDILHAHTLFTNGYIAYKNYKKNGTPYIVTVRDTDLNIFLKYRFYLRPLARKILKNANRVIFISENYKKQLSERYLNNDLKEEVNLKSVVLPNGISSFFYDNMYVKRRTSEIKGTLNIITVGHVMTRKNQLTICKALNLLSKENLDIRYRIVGKILDEKYFEEIKKYNFVEYIPFVKKEELLTLYRESDIFVMASITETFGLTYIEALSQGLPIVYSKGQGIDSYFKNGQVGESVSSEDFDEISTKIKLIGDNYLDYTKNIEDILGDFQWEKIIKKYKDLYIGIVGDKNDI